MVYKKKNRLIFTMMDFKKLIAGVAIVGLGAQVQAQDCAAEVSVYTEYYKVKNYDEAFKSWKFAFDNCPTATKNLYIHGPRIVENRMKKAADADQDSLLSLLFKVYDQRLENFPGKEGYVLGKKGTSMYKYQPEKFEKAYAVLAKAYAIDKNDFSASALTAYFQATGDMYAEEKIDKNTFFEIYDNLNTVIESNMEGKSAKYYQQAAENVEKLVSPFADCVDLEPLYTASFEEKKTDAEWLARAIRMMDKKDCANSDIYFTLAATLYQLQPSSASAASMAKMSFSRKEYAKSAKYFQEAIDGETVNDKLAGYYLEMALSQSKLKQYATAKANAIKAASLKSGFGKPYLLLASMYGESAGDCGTNDFERRAVYWAAMDMCAKAKNVDASVAEIANSLYVSYSKSAPDKTLIFSYGYLEKPEYKVGCWINETTKVRIP
jgi:tetratricopeptide (TPR) repeat protein